jgi:hypothetical protein
MCRGRGRRRGRESGMWKGAQGKGERETREIFLGR